MDQEQQQFRSKERVPDTKKMIEMLEESRTMGSDTATKMSEQTEQLRRIQSSTENIDGELDQSRYLLKKLGLRRRWNKAFKMFNEKGPPTAPKEELKYNKIQKMKEKIYGVNNGDNAEEVTEHKTVNPSIAEIRLRTKNRAERLNSQGNLTDKNVVDFNNNNNNKSNFANDSSDQNVSTPTGYFDLDPTSAEAQEIQEQDEDLNRMSELLGNIKEISLAQQREAELQGHQLDDVTTNVEKVRIKTAAGSRALTMKYGALKK